MRYLTGLAVLATAAAAGAAQNKASEPSAEIKTLVQNCDAHKFETTIQVIAGGKSKSSKVRLCGTEGQSDADWIATLKDAVKKTADNQSMAPAVREQIVAAVNAEIARLSLPQGLTAGGSGLPTVPTARSRAPVPLTRDYGALPPLPTAPSVPPPSLLTQGGSAVPAPRLTLRCALPGEQDRPSDCDSVGANTILVVRADEAFPAGVAMRFVRKGDPRAELDLPAMQAGQTRSLRLPPAVCAGVVWSRLEIQARGGQTSNGGPGGTVGEYELRC
jgi:hypothetical protein